MTSRPSIAPPAARYYDLILAGFVGLLLIANVAATKLIDIGPTWQPGGMAILPLVFDGGALTFPLTYILGDTLAEVYGFGKARRAIIMGFCASALASLVFLGVDLLPADASWGLQESWHAVLGLVPRIVLGSLAGFLVGQLLNAKVLVALRDRARPGSLWFRLIGSTVVGEAADTVLFCLIAYGGLIDWPTMGNYIITGYIYKVALEVILLPISLRVIPWVRRREHSGLAATA